MSGVQCIGRMGGQAGDWYAELDFASGEATVLERTKQGNRGPVATVPLGAFYDADDDHDEALVPNDSQNKALCGIVFAPEAWRVLRMVRDEIAKRKPLDDGVEYTHDRSDYQLLRELNDVLQCQEVAWTCRGCGASAWNAGADDQVFCDDCARAADHSDD